MTSPQILTKQPENSRKKKYNSSSDDEMISVKLAEPPKMPTVPHQLVSQEAEETEPSIIAPCTSLPNIGMFMMVIF